MREALRTAHPLIQLGVLILLGLGAMSVLIFVVGLLYVLGGSDLSVLTNPASLADPNGSGVFALKVLQIMQSIGLFICPYLIYRYVIKGEGYPLFLANKRMGVLITFSATMLAALPMINFLAEWNNDLHLPEFLSGVEQWVRNTENEAEKLIRTFLKMDSVGDLLFNLFLIALIPAVAEEVFFRGTVQPLMLRVVQNHHLAIWLTAFLFSFFHMQFLGFFPRLLLGAVFGYAVHWSGTLLLPMVGHFINNGVAVLITWYIGIEAIDEDIEYIGSNDGDGIFTVLSLVVVISGMIAIYFSSQRLKKKAAEI